MRRTLALLILGGSLLTGGLSAALAAPNTETVALHAPMHTQMMALEHAMGSAVITYTAHDATIKLTTEMLPSPVALHEHVYVLWLAHGSRQANAGSFTVHNGMGALHAMTMDTTFTKLVVTAEKAAHAMHPMGVKVLTGNVMMHRG
jgi:hypothetical protein